MEEQAPVLVVGGSLVGLTASVLLARFGVPHVVIERHRGTAIHPRAAAFHQRTLEIYRSVGLQQAVEQAAEREFVQNGAIMAVDALAGRELAWFYRSVNDGVEDLSPARRLFITQIGLEPVLRERAAALGAELRYGTEMTGFTQDDDGVTAVVRSRDDGRERRIRARWMIAADGAHSPVRRALGLPMTGRGDFAQCFTIYFRADVRDLLRGRNLSVVYVNQPGLLAFFRFSITADAGFLAVFSVAGADAGTEPDHSKARCAALVRAALGVDEGFPVEIENVQPWTAAADAAGVFRQDRIFLAGDAAHTMPPTGGFGGNTGVADVHNLVWKLAMVLDGRAGPALLDSYDAERRPIGALTVEQAYRRYVERVDPTLPSNDLEPNLADTAIELGAVYRSEAVIAEGEDGGRGEGDGRVEAPERPTGRPGTRLPHLWIDRDGAHVSTLDLADDGFVLLAGPGGRAWVDAAERRGLKAHRIPEAGFKAAVGIASDGALLLRPDGVIGWRSKEGAADPDAILTDALRRLTGC